MQQEAFQRANYERILVDEVLRVLPVIRIPPTMLLNIVRKIKGKAKLAQVPYEKL